jgi:hypothetical protein
LYLLVTERCKKKFKNLQWKSCACVPLTDSCGFSNRAWFLILEGLFDFFDSLHHHPLPTKAAAWCRDSLSLIGCLRSNVRLLAARQHQFI